MSQASLVLSTTPPFPGLSLVQALNNALDALASGFSGSSDPAAYAKPFSVWNDTSQSPPVRRIRNAENSAWIEIGPVLTAFGDAAYRDAVGEGDLYSRGGIVGTVSQTDGVPTGAIIQTGTNAGGRFIRFADGTQLCHRFSSASPGNVDPGEEVPLATSTSLPATFASAPELLVSLAGGYTNRFTATFVGGSNTTVWPSIGGCNASAYATSATFQIHAFAIGRWFE